MEKKKAAYCLKRKTHHEKLIEQTENCWLQLIELIEKTEMTRLQSDVTRAMEAGNSVMKSLQKELTADRVQSVLDEASDCASYVDEINELMSGYNVTDADIEKELAEIEAQEADEAMLNMQSVPAAPLPPSSRPTSQKVQTAAAPNTADSPRSQAKSHVRAPMPRRSR